jgi:hypothetical protein
LSSRPLRSQLSLSPLAPRKKPQLLLLSPHLLLKKLLLLSLLRLLSRPPLTRLPLLLTRLQLRLKLLRLPLSSTNPYRP